MVTQTYFFSREKMSGGRVRRGGLATWACRPPEFITTTTTITTKLTGSTVSTTTSQCAKKKKSLVNIKGCTLNGFPFSLL